MQLTPLCLPGGAPGCHASEVVLRCAIFVTPFAIPSLYSSVTSGSVSWARLEVAVEMYPRLLAGTSSPSPSPVEALYLENTARNVYLPPVMGMPPLLRDNVEDVSLLITPKIVDMTVTPTFAFPLLAIEL
jgi:hypothetical protein